MKNLGSEDRKNPARSKLSLLILSFSAIMIKLPDEINPMNSLPESLLIIAGR